MTVISRTSVRLKITRRSALTGELMSSIAAGTLLWDVPAKSLVLVNPRTQEEVLVLTDHHNPESKRLPEGFIYLMDVNFADRLPHVPMEANGALDSLAALGILKTHHYPHPHQGRCVIELNADLGAALQEEDMRIAAVTLFKPSGRYADTDHWRVPVRANSPVDMLLSPDFRRIDNGPVLVNAQEGPHSEDFSWGIPALLLAEEPA